MKKYVGSYYSKELLTEYKIDLAGGKLLMHHFRVGDFEIRPDAATRDRFFAPLGQIDFIKDRKQRVNGFKVSGGRVKNIQFDRQL